MKLSTRCGRSALTVAAASALVLTAGCTADPGSTAPSGDSRNQGNTQRPLRVDQALHDQLPAGDQAQSKKVVAVNTGSFPPYTIVGSEGAQLQGATGDIGPPLALSVSSSA